MMLPKIATPKYDMIVPSTGEKVTYRPYLIKEERILMIALESQNENQIEQSILDILTTCFDLKTEASGLTVFDVEYMFMKLRSVSVGEKIKLAPKCESCEEPGEVTVDLSEVKVQGLKEEQDLNKQIKLSDELTIDMHFPKVGDAVKADTGTDTIIGTVAKCVDTIYYGEDTFNTADSSEEEVKEFIENLNTTQFQKIANVLQEVPYLGHNVKWTCKECDFKNDLELKGLINFFT